MKQSFLVSEFGTYGCFKRYRRGATGLHRSRMATLGDGGHPVSVVGSHETRTMRLGRYEYPVQRESKSKKEENKGKNKFTNAAQKM